MSINDPLQYIEKIVLEIINRPWVWFHPWRTRHIRKFDIARFNAREAAYAFLRQYNGEPFVKAQKISVWYHNEELHLCVRDLIYGTFDTDSKRSSSSTVEFAYQEAMFSEIKWPAIAISRTNRVRWASDSNEQPLEPLSSSEISTRANVPDIHINSDYSSINFDQTANADTRIVPCKLCDNLDDDPLLPVNSTPENINTSSCRIHRSVSGLQRLISDDNGSLTLGHTTDDDSHFRSSIYIHIKNNSS